MPSTDPTPEQLREHEREQELASRRAAAGAASEEEARVELRRAEKARYLKGRLDEQVQADREQG